MGDFLVTIVNVRQVHSIDVCLSRQMRTKHTFTLVQYGLRKCWARELQDRALFRRMILFSWQYVLCTNKRTSFCP